MKNQIQITTGAVQNALTMTLKQYQSARDFLLMLDQKQVSTWARYMQEVTGLSAAFIEEFAETAMKVELNEDYTFSIDQNWNIISLDGNEIKFAAPWVYLS